MLGLAGVTAATRNRWPPTRPTATTTGLICAGAHIGRGATASPISTGPHGVKRVSTGPNRTCRSKSPPREGQQPAHGGEPARWDAVTPGLEQRDAPRPFPDVGSARLSDPQGEHQWTTESYGRHIERCRGWPWVERAGRLDGSGARRGPWAHAHSIGSGARPAALPPERCAAFGQEALVRCHRRSAVRVAQPELQRSSQGGPEKRSRT